MYTASVWVTLFYKLLNSSLKKSIDETISLTISLFSSFSESSYFLRCFISLLFFVLFYFYFPYFPYFSFFSFGECDVFTFGFVFFSLFIFFYDKSIESLSVSLSHCSWNLEVTCLVTSSLSVRMLTLVISIKSLFNRSWLGMSEDIEISLHPIVNEHLVHFIRELKSMKNG